MRMHGLYFSEDDNKLELGGFDPNDNSKICWKHVAQLGCASCGYKREEYWEARALAEQTGNSQSYSGSGSNDYYGSSYNSGGGSSGSSSSGARKKRYAGEEFAERMTEMIKNHNKGELFRSSNNDGEMKNPFNT